MRASLRLLNTLVVGASILAASSARAQTSPPIAPNPQAVALFNEARELMEAGNYEDACPKLEQSRRIQTGMGTLFNLGDCYEHIGRIASAWSSFMDVAVAADAAGQPQRAQAARERADLLAKRIPKLRIVVSSELAQLGVDVRLDALPIGALVWGTDIPVDPGRHRVIASAPGRTMWNTAVDLMEPGKVVEVKVPMLWPPGDPEDPPLDARRQPIPADGAPTSQGHRSVGLVVGLGVAALAGIGAGAGLLVASNADRDSAASIRASLQGGGAALNGCLASPKPADCDRLDSELRAASTLRGVAIGAFIGGGLAAAGMATYLLLPGSSSPSPLKAAAGSIRVVPAIGLDSGGAIVVGRF